MSEPNVRIGVFPQLHNIVIHVGQEAVHVSFITAGERIPLRLEAGTVAPARDAQFYVTLDGGVPIRSQTKKELVEEINAAVETGVFWQVQMSQAQDHGGGGTPS